MPVGLSTSEAIARDPFARAAAVKTWRQPPDFVSVNFSELGWAGIVRAALHAGIGVEAGLSTPADAEELARSPFAHQLVGRLWRSTAASRKHARSRSSFQEVCHSCGTVTATEHGR